MLLVSHMYHLQQNVTSFCDILPKWQVVIFVALKANHIKQDHG